MFVVDDGDDGGDSIDCKQIIPTWPKKCYFCDRLSFLLDDW